MTELVLRSQQEGVVTLTLNRPEALNALSPQLFIELDGHLRRLETEADSVGAVILTGAGRSFSAGNDLRAIQAGQTAPTPHFQAETIDRLEALPQVVVGSVRGHCYTGALELVLGCDLILCADDARFCDTHGKLGLVPIWGMTQRLPRRVGKQNAMEVMFASRVVTGAQAAQIGLALRCVPGAELDEATMTLARELAANSRWTLSHEKRTLADTANMTYRAALDHERLRSAGRSPDSAQRIAALLNRGR
jgi:enoyl-CoA hydratase